jgi:hypothetical protein
MAVSVLDGQLSLADPTQPIHRPRLDDRRRLAGLQLLGQSFQQLVTAGEVGVAGRHVGDFGSLVGKARRYSPVDPPARTTWKARLLFRPAAAQPYTLQQPSPGGGPVDPHKVDVDHGGK